MSRTQNQIFKELSSTFPEIGLTFDETVPCIVVPAASIRVICEQLRDAGEYSFDFLMCLSGVDYADGTMGVVYHLHSMKNDHYITLKVIVQTEDPHVVSVEHVWRTADWHEREAYDMYGIIFDGHRDLRRILMPDDWEGYPLRKDYEVPEFYNGIKVPY